MHKQHKKRRRAVPADRRAHDELLECMRARAPMMMMDDRRWGGRCRDEPQLCMQMSMRGAMYVTMTMMRPGLFLQREEPGSEPGNSLVRPDGHM